MKRRDFTKLAGVTALASAELSMMPINFMNRAERIHSRNIQLGVCNHSLRAIRPKAQELIKYAIDNKLDSVQFNSLNPFESLEDDYLIEIKDLAKSNDIQIYVSVGSICDDSKIFFDNYGDAKTLLSKGIKVAKALESPVLGVYIGMKDDRYTGEGIEPKKESIVGLMQSMRRVMLDSNMKFAVENHAGDLRSSELVELINQTGTDICGALYDPGNAIYALEDPMVALETLGKYILNTTVRDVMIWPTAEGATFQWTAVGEGLMDYKRFVDFMADNCPGVPINIETISNTNRSIPFLKPDFWNGYKDLAASEITPFIKLIRRGSPKDVIEPQFGYPKVKLDTRLQKLELSKSIDYLRNECGVGIKG